VDAEGASPYLVMELVPGRSLNKFVEEEGPIRSGMLWSIALGLVEALASIHAAGIIHRDLKPSNILVGSDGVKVVDFGVSALHEVSSLTSTGEFIGTASWVSPEQVVGRPITESSDVFSLGMVLAYASSGVHPFGLGRTDAIMYRIAHEPPDLSSVPDGLVSVIESCLNKNPVMRPSLKTLEGSFRKSSLMKGLGGLHDDSTLIVGQSAIEFSINDSKLGGVSESGSSRSRFRATRRSWAIFAAVLVIGVATLFVVQSRDDDSSIKNTDVANTVVKTVDDKDPDLVDAFALNLEKLIYRATSASRMTFGVGLLNTWDNDISQIWGAQLDCNNYYPLYDLGFGDSSVTLKSGSMVNETKANFGSYVINYRFFTGFKEDARNFTRRAAVAESKFSGCNDLDYFPSRDVAIEPCLGNVFKDGKSAFLNLNETCAKSALKNYKYTSSGRNNKYGIYPESPINGNVGSEYVIAVTPDTSNECCVSGQLASVMVWEREDIGVVLSVSGINRSYNAVSYSTRAQNVATYLNIFSRVANDLVIDVFGS
jgi:serine/threonine protein kinase